VKVLATSTIDILATIIKDFHDRVAAMATMPKEGLTKALT